jgi:hypothetical protein
VSVCLKGDGFVKMKWSMIPALALVFLAGCGGSGGGDSRAVLLHYAFDSSIAGAVTNHPANASIAISGDSPFNGNGALLFSYSEIENDFFLILFPVTSANLSEISNDVVFEFMVKVSHPGAYMAMITENADTNFYAYFHPKTTGWEKISLRSFELYPSQDNIPPDYNAKFDAENMTRIVLLDTAGWNTFENTGARSMAIDEFFIYADTAAPTPAAELPHFKIVDMGKVGLTMYPPYDDGIPNNYLVAYRDCVELGCQLAPKDDVKWTDYEKIPGSPDFSALVTLRDFYASRCPQFFERTHFNHRVNVVNMHFREEMPSDLAGAAFDNATLISRYTAFVKAYFAAIGVGNESFCFFVANEADTYFQLNEGELPAFKTFYAAVKAGIKADYPNVRIGCITKYHGDRQDIIQGLNNSSDVVAFTYYGHNPANFSYANLAPLDNVFSGMIALAGGKQVVITEIGFATSALLNSTEDMQAAYITEFFDTYPAYRNSIEWATYCMQADMGDDILEILKDTIFGGLPLPPEFSAYLQNLGLYKNDHTPKKAVAAWKAGMSKYYKNY